MSGLLPNAMASTLAPYPATPPQASAPRSLRGAASWLPILRGAEAPTSDEGGSAVIVPQKGWLELSREVQNSRDLLKGGLEKTSRVQGCRVRGGFCTGGVGTLLFASRSAPFLRPLFCQRFVVDGAQNQVYTWSVTCQDIFVQILHRRLLQQGSDTRGGLLYHIHH